MSYVYYNANPYKKTVGDCTIRAISTVTGLSWDIVYLGICFAGFENKDILSSNNVWQDFLYRIGFRRRVVPNSYINNYTISDFCLDHPVGRYILGTGDHVVAVVDGNYYDTADSGDDIVMYYWQEGETYV